jgi:hypothetical protein
MFSPVCSLLDEAKRRCNDKIKSAGAYKIEDSNTSMSVPAEQLLTSVRNLFS